MNATPPPQGMEPEWDALPTVWAVIAGCLNAVHVALDSQHVERLLHHHLHLHRRPAKCTGRVCMRRCMCMQCRYLAGGPESLQSIQRV